MRYVILIAILAISCLAIKAQQNQPEKQTVQTTPYDQARFIAIHDFSKTKLYKQDSVFDITVYDTLYTVAFDTVSKNSYKAKRGQPYPDIIAVDILGYPMKYFLDTTLDLSHQKGIPSRFIEQNGKIFIWWDKQYPLTDSTVRTLDKFHLIGRGKGDDWYKFVPGVDDAKRAAQYFFCRNNLSVYKRKITNTAIGWYDPPTIRCE